MWGCEVLVLVAKNIAVFRRREDRAALKGGGLSCGGHRGW